MKERRNLNRISRSRDDSPSLAHYLAERVGPLGIVDVFVDNLGPELSAHLAMANYVV